MKRWKERLSRLLGSRDRPELDQAKQLRQAQRQQQGQPPRTDGKPPRRPPAPMSQGSARGSRASYDASMLGRPSGRHSGSGPVSAGREPKVSPSCPGASVPCSAGAVCCLLSWHLPDHARLVCGRRGSDMHASVRQDTSPACCMWTSGFLDPLFP